MKTEEDRARRGTIVNPGKAEAEKEQKIKNVSDKKMSHPEEKEEIPEMTDEMEIEKNEESDAEKTAQKGKSFEDINDEFE